MAAPDDEVILRDWLALDRTLLANERTLLAYARTGLVLIFGGVSVPELVSAGPIPVGLGVLAAAAGVVTLGVGAARWWSVKRRYAGLLARRPGRFD